MYNVQQREIRNLFTKEVKRVNFEIRAENGDLYGTVDTQADAEIVAFGLNHGFIQHILGGFSPKVVEEIKKAMAGDSPAAWAIEI